MQDACRLSDAEAYGTLNMGAGFAGFFAPAEADAAISAARRVGIGALHAGTVESGPKRIVIEPLGIEYQADELQLRD
jgi:phosphoribosylformylglycinamidine cyclo-ligase